MFDISYIKARRKKPSNSTKFNFTWPKFYSLFNNTKLNKSSNELNKKNKKSRLNLQTRLLYERDKDRKNKQLYNNIEIHATIQIRKTQNKSNSTKPRVIFLTKFEQLNERYNNSNCQISEPKVSKRKRKLKPNPKSIHQIKSNFGIDEKIEPKVELGFLSDQQIDNTNFNTCKSESAISNSIRDTISKSEPEFVQYQSLGNLKAIQDFCKKSLSQKSCNLSVSQKSSNLSASQKSCNLSESQKSCDLPVSEKSSSSSVSQIQSKLTHSACEEIQSQEKIILSRCKSECPISNCAVIDGTESVSVNITPETVPELLQYQSITNFKTTEEPRDISIVVETQSKTTNISGEKVKFQLELKSEVNLLSNQLKSDEICSPEMPTNSDKNINSTNLDIDSKLTKKYVNCNQGTNNLHSDLDVCNKIQSNQEQKGGHIERTNKVYECYKSNSNQKYSNSSLQNCNYQQNQLVDKRDLNINFESGDSKLKNYNRNNPNQVTFPQSSTTPCTIVCENCQKSFTCFNSTQPDHDWFCCIPQPSKITVEIPYCTSCCRSSIHCNNPCLHSNSNCSNCSNTFKCCSNCSRPYCIECGRPYINYDCPDCCCSYTDCQ